MKHLFLVVALLVSVKVKAQDDLLKMLKDDTQQVTNYANGTFKGARIISGQTVEMVGKDNLNYWINHRFGRLNEGAYNAFGLDAAYVHMGLEYGLTNNLNVGIGRTGIEKAFDMYLKYRVLRQSAGKKNMPFTVTLFLNNDLVSEKSKENAKGTIYNSNKERQNVSFQALIARKFSESFSLQLMPTVLHLGQATASGKQIVPSMGVGGRLKISKRTSINGEYYWINEQVRKDLGTYNSLSLGFDIETGGHVFQLHFTNTTGMIPKQFLTGTLGSWSKGDVHYGFNISRTFSFGKKSAVLKQQ